MDYNYAGKPIIIALSAMNLPDIQRKLRQFAEERDWDKLGIDIEEEVKRKMAVNEEKYPVELSKGNATKYNRR